METAVALLCFVLFFAGTGLLIAGARRGKTTVGGIRRIAVGFLILGFALLLPAGVNVFFIATSPRPQVVGNIGILHQYSGRSAGASTFTVVADDGSRTAVHTNYNGNGLEMGERVRVRYLAYNGKLLEFESLSPPFTGWHFNEPSPYIPWIVLAIIGSAFLQASYRYFREVAPEERV